MQVFQRIGDILAAIGDNMKGIQDDGGRKTATEVRTSGEAGASRLAARARLVSAQGMVDLAEQMSLNIQQLMTQEFYLQVVGSKGMQNPITIGPQMVAGDFFFPVNDGTLPIDKTALLAVWKEIWMAITQNPMLAQKYDEGKLFEYIAEIGGAKNISAFRVSMAPDAQVQNGAAAGNLVPLGPPGPRSPTPNSPGGGGGTAGPRNVALNAGQLGPGRIGPGTAG
jgi:hypothetical protein